MTRRTKDALLVVWRRVKLTGPPAAAALVERTSPRHLLEIDPLLRLEDGGAANRRQGGQGRWKASGGRLVHAAGVGAVVATGHEMRHPLRQRPVLDAGVGVAVAAGGIRLACPKALGDDRPHVVRHHLVEGSIAVAEVGRR